MKKMGVIKLRTIAYNPQANGLTEQSTSAVKSSLCLWLNKVYGNRKTNHRYHSIDQFQNSIYEIYDIARNNMNTQQKVLSTSS